MLSSSLNIPVPFWSKTLIVATGPPSWERSSCASKLEWLENSVSLKSGGVVTSTVAYFAGDDAPTIGFCASGVSYCCCFRLASTKGISVSGGEGAMGGF
jgi:hypothetical protein